jgi:antitoxin component YwqK of YwqJK toxin-antitoxin module
MRYIGSLIILVALGHNALLAQRQMFTESKDLFARAKTFEEQKDYALAERELAKIPFYDSTYEDALWNRMNLLNRSKDFDRALKLATEGVDLDGNMVVQFEIGRISAYSGKGDYDQAIGAAQEASFRHPASYTFHMLKATNQRLKGDRKAALVTLTHALELNPSMVSAHIELGLLALSENETARFMMSMLTVLFINDDPAQNNRVLALLNNVLTSKKDSVPQGIFEGSDEDYSRLNLMLDNYVAMDDKYKTGVKVDQAVLRHTHLLLTQLEKLPQGGSGPWATICVPFLRRIWNESRYDATAHFLLSFSGNEAHKAAVAKKSADIAEFKKVLHKLVNEVLATRQGACGTGLVEVSEYSRSGGLTARTCLNKATGKYEGDLIEYNKNGQITSKGKLAGGEKMGQWVFYHDNGKVKLEAEILHDKGNGLMKRYHSNGNLSTKGELKGGDRTGTFEEYHPNGKLSLKANYTDNEIDGLKFEYYPSGVLSDSVNFINGLAEGRFSLFHTNGKPRKVGTLAKGKFNGSVTEYYMNGVKQGEFRYVDGELEGEVLEYAENGTLNYKGLFAKGKKIGKHTRMRDDGSLDWESEYDESGRHNGTRIIYDYEGRKHEMYDYDKDMIVGYRFFDNQGRVVIEGKKKGGGFEYRSIYFNGSPSSTGLYTAKGGKEGRWETKAVEGGFIESVNNYEDNKQSGNQKYYHFNGKVKLDYGAKDDEKDGEYREYYSNGTLKRHFRATGGTLYGEEFFYEADGKLDQINYHAGGYRQWEVHYGCDSMIQYKFRFTDGLMDSIIQYGPKGNVIYSTHLTGGDGTIQYRYADGSKWNERTYVNGSLHGKTTTWGIDGKVLNEDQYFEDELTGPRTYRRFNGNIIEETSYDQQGRKHGNRKVYDLFGALAIDENYINGQIEGVSKSFHSNGKVDHYSEYKNGDFHGKREFYSFDGQLMMVRYYDHGLLVSYSYNGPDGKLVQPKQINLAKDTLRSYYTNGKLARQYAIINGNIDGELIEYYPDGKVAYKATYKDGEEQGVATEFFPNGKMMSEKAYQHGEYHGRQVHYWDTGTPRLQYFARYGIEHGTWTEYDRNGKAVREFELWNGTPVSSKKL